MMACPVCFGSVTTPLIDAARAGVLTMIAVTLVVLAGFAAWFLRIRALTARLPDDRGGATVPADPAS
jgi:predicted transporter